MTIRVGIIGLSTSGWALLAHLPYFTQTDKYKIVALANSTKQAAIEAIEKLKLDSQSIKAYGSPQELAQDPNVDLVVVSVNVAKHKELVWPAIEAGKDVFVEWPVGKDAKEGKEIADFARQKKVKNVVGLQGRYHPQANKIREIIQSGRIGKLLSSTFVGTAGMLIGGKLSEQVWYLADDKIGGNLSTIFLGHYIDIHNWTLGQKFVDFSAITANQFDKVDLTDKEGQVVKSDVPKDTLDQILIQGHLTDGGLSTVHIRDGVVSTSDVQTRWWIFGTKGQIEITCSTKTFLNGAFPWDVTLFDLSSGEKEKITADLPFEKVDHPLAANIARVYDAYARQDGTFVTLDEAVELKTFIEKVKQASAEQHAIKL